MPKNQVSDLITEQETEGLRRKNQWREQVLERLWEIANLPAEATRGSITGQVKALSMIVALEGLIPDRRGSSDNKSAPTPPPPDIYAAAWLRQPQGKTIDPQPGAALVDKEHKEDEAGLAEPEPAPGSTEDAPPPPIFDHGFANRPNSSEMTPSVSSAPDTRVPFSIKKNLLARRR